MPNAERISRPATVATKRVGTAVWILRLNGGVDTHADDLSSAFDEAIARGARDVVVDVGRRAIVDAELATTLSALNDTMLERDSTLWLAAPWPNGRGHTLKPVREPGLDGLRGVSDELDDAIDRTDARARSA
jgi:hypothetical protein